VSFIRKSAVSTKCTIWWESGHKGEPNEAPTLGRTKLTGAGDIRVHKMRVFYPKHYPVPKINVVLLLFFIVIYACTFVPKYLLPKYGRTQFCIYASDAELVS
jgi:hypothetical protein